MKRFCKKNITDRNTDSKKNTKQFFEKCY